jgi:hypothetical protein
MIDKIFDFIGEVADWYQNLPRRDQNRVLFAIIKVAAFFALLAGIIGMFTPE